MPTIAKKKERKRFQDFYLVLFCSSSNCQDSVFSFHLQAYCYELITKLRNKIRENSQETNVTTKKNKSFYFKTIFGFLK